MTLHYDFPVIENISDVLPHLDDHFRIVEKDGWTFINYKMMGLDVFPHVANTADGSALRAAIRRECRGIVFDTKTGNIVSRPFHKFFNAGEREDVSLDKIDTTRPHRLLEKLDGSMIRPLDTGRGFRWGTKMGITDVGMMAETFVASCIAEGVTSYLDIAHYCRGIDATPLFEFCSRENRVVINYPVSTMVLLAIRDNVTGQYMDREELRILAKSFNCPVIEGVDHTALGHDDRGPAVGVASLDLVMSNVKESADGEGKVLVFDDGHAVKIKSDWYVRVHRAKDMMRSEMRLLDLVFNEELDDLLAAILPEDRARIESYLESFYNEANHLSDRLQYSYTHVRATFETKKDFALSDYAKDMNQTMKSLIFGLWDRKYGCPHDAAHAVIRNAMSSETKFASMKETMEFNTGWDDVWAVEMEDAA